MVTKRKLFYLLQFFFGFLLVTILISANKNSNQIETNINAAKNAPENDKIVDVPPSNDELIFASYIQYIINFYNKNQIILNNDKFEPLRNDSVVIVVQVHRRLEYLRYLIGSLSNATDISQVLLIFSHDFYDNEINKLIRSITFCRVLQIFYPYSIQTHPNVFPGTDPMDCMRDMNQKQAKEMKCNNFDSPDSFGHYREARYAQIKHHWWWKANRVFEQLEATKNHKGMVLFLEEDHYVAPDFLYILNLMEQKAPELCEQCKILVLGKYLKVINSNLFANKNVLTGEWVSSVHNMGMAFNRNIWMDIKSCSHIFCTYDDYNWDWSLQYISRNCMKTKLHGMSLSAPRVFHIGQCGTHAVNNDRCDSDELITILQQTFDFATKENYFYPDNLSIGYGYVPIVLQRKNGGWGDKRDHQLCLNIAKDLK